MSVLRPGAAWIPLAAAALAACVPLAGPEVAPPALEAPDDWTARDWSDDESAPAAAPSERSAASTPPLGAPEPAEAAWWRALGDPGLDRAVERALAANRDLAAAAARIEAATAQARIAGAALRPQASAGLDAGRSRRNFLGFPIPGSEGAVLSTTNTAYGAALNLSWEADLWGRLRAGSSAARAGAEAAAEEYSAARLSLAGQTAKAWFALVEAGRQLELAEETLEARRRTTGQIQRRFNAGLRGPLDLRLAMTSEAAAEAALAGRRRLVDLARRQLELLASDYPAGAPRPDTESADLPAPPVEVPAGLPAELVSRRPDLRLMERLLEQAGWGIRQARAAFYPGLNLTASAGRSTQDLEDLLDSDFSVWSLAARLLQPLYAGGRLAAGLELAEARYRELAETYAQRALDAFAQVELALVAERELEAQDRALAEAAHQASAAERLANDRYRSGLAGYLTVLTAEAEALAARSRHLEVRRQRLEARIDLHLALGGGFELADPEPADGAAPDPAGNAPKESPR